MSRRRDARRRAGSEAARTVAAEPAPAAVPEAEPSLARRRAFLAFTLLVPVLLLAAVEGVLRLTWPAGGLPLFVPDARTDGAYLVANPRVGARWFAGESSPPAPMAEPFAARKPARAFRVFVMGESSVAGFPYPRNGTFTRLLRDALRDVLPGDSVELMNLGIAATNSYAMLDVVDEVVAQRPDAVLLYAGHNEYYGALGVGSTQGRGGAAPALVRGYLRLLRLRSVLLVRDGLARVRRAAGARPGADAGEASFMESLAREQEIALGGATYARGLRQYEENLTRLVRRLRAAGVPVLVGSVASNLRDQRPFAAAANRRGAGADAVFDSARAALARRDSGAARALFTRAHDLDVVRFRAPTAFDHVVRRVAAATGATYVPVREAFAAASPGGIAGEELFLEHVHPTRRGHVLLARAYFEALVRSGGLARTARLERLRTWAAYEQAMALTPFDERIAAHTVATLRERWPFVPADRQGDYRARHRAHGTVDSLALLVSRGAPWAATKLQLAQHFLSLGHADSAAAELRGLVRDAPLAEEPRRLLAGALLAGGDSAGAVAALEEAWAVRPTAATATLLGAVALQRRDLPRAIAELRRSLALEPDRPAVLYQLSLAYGLARDLEGARTTALRVAQLDPRHPGLPGWMQAIGLRP